MVFHFHKRFIFIKINFAIQSGITLPIFSENGCDFNQDIKAI